MKKTHLRAALIVVLVHATLNLVHASAHFAERILLPPIANAFVIVMIMLAPFLAVGLLYARHQRAGAWLLFGSMFGALVFGALYHIVLTGPDNMMHAANGLWQLMFQVSAILLVVTEVIGTAIAGRMLYTLHRLV